MSVVTKEMILEYFDELDSEIEGKGLPSDVNREDLAQVIAERIEQDFEQWVTDSADDFFEIYSWKEIRAKLQAHKEKK